MKFVNEPDKIDGFRVVQDYEEMAEALKNGDTIYHWEMGDSMEPLINNMEYCKVRPLIDGEEVKEGDAVFCKVSCEDKKEHYMVHMVLQKSNAGHDSKTWYKIGNTSTMVFGWTNEILGLAYGTDIYQEMTDEIINGWLSM